MKYRGDLSEYTYEQVQATYKHIQRKVYDTLLELSPERLEFEMNILPDERSFCMTAIDQETYDIIGHIMGELMENDDLVLTKADMILCYVRFKQLLFFHAAEKQGLLKAEVTDTGITRHYTIGDDEDEQLPKIEPKVFRGRHIRIFRNHGNNNR